MSSPNYYTVSFLSDFRVIGLKLASKNSLGHSKKHLFSLFFPVLVYWSLLLHVLFYQE